MEFVVKDLFSLIDSDVVLAESLKDALQLKTSLVAIRIKAAHQAIVPYNQIRYFWCWFVSFYICMR